MIEKKNTLKKRITVTPTNERFSAYMPSETVLQNIGQRPIATHVKTLKYNPGIDPFNVLMHTPQAVENEIRGNKVKQRILGTKVRDTVKTKPGILGTSKVQDPGTGKWIVDTDALAELESGILSLISPIRTYHVKDVRKLLPVNKYGHKPIYTREWVESHPETLSLQLDRKGFGTLGEQNNSKYDIIDMHMNVDGNNIGFNPRDIVTYALNSFDNAAHGLIISMGAMSHERPLSYDSYPFMQNFLSKMEKEGKGMWIKTPEGYSPNVRLNKMAVNNDVETANRMVSKNNKRYGTTFAPIIDTGTEFTPTLLKIMEKMPSFRKTFKPLPIWSGQSLEFIKFKNGGNI